MCWLQPPRRAAHGRDRAHEPRIHHTTRMASAVGRQPHARPAEMRLLDPHESSRLRASCGLPRFAAIVEELVLNAVDAGAQQIVCQIDVPAFSCSVVDDGHGLTTSDLRLIGQRFITSNDFSGP